MAGRGIRDSAGRLWNVEVLFSQVTPADRQRYTADRFEAWSVFAASREGERVYFRAPNAALQAEDAHYLAPLIESSITRERMVPAGDPSGWHVSEAGPQRFSAVSGAGESPLDRVRVRCSKGEKSFEMEMPLWWRSPLDMPDEDLLNRILDA